MNKSIPYILGGLMMIALVIMFTFANSKRSRVADERITLRKKDKIPYGTYVAYNSLKYIFPNASISTSKREPGYWDSLSNNEQGQVFLSVSGQFNADEPEMKSLIRFVEKGNDVFISARYLSAAVDNITKNSSSAYDIYLYSSDEMASNMKISLANPPFGADSIYRYPGKKFSTYFGTMDTSTTEVLGYSENGRPNFIRMRAGEGFFYLHTEPLAFSNYFLLYKKNISYFEKILSMISPNASRLVWDEYYLQKRADSQKKNNNWLSVLFRYPALKAALLTAIFALLLYVLLEMRRKQRYIPVWKRPSNDSLDFVRTIGRLYYDKGDHRDLCRKMGSYFLEHVRSRYKLSTTELDEEFIQNLKYKSGAGDQEIRTIVSFINYLKEAPGISNAQLVTFHKELESFYNKT